MNPKQIARVCHEVNRAYCASIGDDSQVPWQDASTDLRKSAVDGVNFHLNNPDAEASASHENWLVFKAEQGYEYGEEKSEEDLTHPCFVPFDELPLEQQAKDHIFKAIVNSLADENAPYE
jgi:hypothetical protein